MQPSKKIIAKRKHGQICAFPPESPFGYFGWPNAAITTDGVLTVAASGFRNTHVCPFGKIVIFRSHDHGMSWDTPQIVVSSEIDVRDSALTPLSGGRLLLSYFTSDTRFYYTNGRNTCPNKMDFGPLIHSWTDDMVRRELGSFTRILETDGSIGPRRPAPVAAPHGPILGKDGELYYAGTVFGRYAPSGELDFSMQNLAGTPDMPPELALYKSIDEGRSWLPIAERIAVNPPEKRMRFYEPYLVEKRTGDFLLLLRGEAGNNNISVWKTESDLSGTNWSSPEMIAAGSPPHALHHSSGLLILSAGYRKEPYGERIFFSSDEGKTWDTDWILHEDGICSDLGYPTTVELPDSSLFTAYYQSPAHFTPPGVLYTKWELPEIYQGRKFR